ncbi:hypothetical protein MFLAVUS_002493 [Mucor flavus]|uniref:Uncharacterized protein n=1 Tax=Mucor flavus TaxID=439312 RepID=A0ABP9YQH6_9FUNG
MTTHPRPLPPGQQRPLISNNIPRPPFVPQQNPGVRPYAPNQPQHYSPQQRPQFSPQGPQHHSAQRPIHHAPQRPQLPQQPLGTQPYSPQQSQQFQMNRPSPVASPIEQQMRDMHIDNAVQKPGRSKRVYATGPSTPLPSTNTQPQPISSFNQTQTQGQIPQPVDLTQNVMPTQPGQPMPVQDLGPKNTPLGLPPRPNVKPRIDPDQIPSPIPIQEKDQELYQRPEYYYGTCANDILPLACTDFKTLDQGNCNPRFMRLTLNSVPQTNDLVKDTGFPFGIVVQPLASIHAEDADLPLVPLISETSEPSRCSRCKGYLNPWCKFTEAGKKFVCNLCNFQNVVPEDQYCPIDMNGRRMDTESRPELMFGSVEFDVPKDYWNDIEPKPLHHLFAIDVSINAVRSGMLTIFCQTIKQILAKGAFPLGMKVGIVTYDSSVHFYNLQAGLEQATMMIVSDIDDVFVPISNGLFVDPMESRSLIEGLMDQLPILYRDTVIPNAAFSSAIQSALIAMKSTGGKVSIMHTSLPSIGPGILKNRDDPKLQGTEREKGLLVPQDNFYPQLAAECVRSGISVDSWFFPPVNTYIDVATIGIVSAMTGGDTHYFPNFNLEREGCQVTHDLMHAIAREQGYRAAFRLRCSNGLTVSDQYGNFAMSNATDIELAGVNADTSVGIELKHDDKLPENSQVYFQCALLYTTAQGQRRVRVHNLSGSVGTIALPVFKQADLDTTMNFIIKRTITLSAKKTINDLSNELDTFCVKILTAYRKFCASGATAAQLILPESFKVLPLLLASFKKSEILRKDPSLTFDMRAYFLQKIKNLSIPGTIKWLYPRCIRLDLWLQQKDKSLTPLERLSYDRFESVGVYWVESHQGIFLWIGKDASADLVQDIFGVSDLNQINPSMNQLPVLGTASNVNLRMLYSKSTENTPYLPLLHVIRHGLDLEVELSKVLVEDETFNQMSYVDYLCMIHKQIQLELEREKHDVVISAASYWAYRY